MAQYWTYNEGNYRYFTLSDGTKCRRGMRDGQLVEDWELEVGGFSLAENVGWDNVSANYGPDTFTSFREGVRDCKYVIDGFTTEWEQLI